MLFGTISCVSGIDIPICLQSLSCCKVACDCSTDCRCNHTDELPAFFFCFCHISVFGGEPPYSFYRGGFGSAKVCRISQIDFISLSDIGSLRFGTIYSVKPPSCTELIAPQLFYALACTMTLRIASPSIPGSAHYVMGGLGLSFFNYAS